eukprot:TRINITY_DN2153_c0_g1_i1.p1 TRINITY_DN2153_c0_g1~~TRINITY_DN2153_c0_g1_i1.p1  ORF type:complete len:1989 (-),score=536.03 TRINITY_DN2153_c0_g1_i1:43-6009(-)
MSNNNSNNTGSRWNPLSYIWGSPEGTSPKSPENNNVDNNNAYLNGGGTLVGEDPVWTPNKIANKCFSCGREFGIFIRRHHCRVCGHVFCQKCSEHTIPDSKKPGPVPTLVRVCDHCYNKKKTAVSQQSDISLAVNRAANDPYLKRSPFQTDSLPPINPPSDSDGSTDPKTLLKRRNTTSSILSNTVHPNGPSKGEQMLTPRGVDNSSDLGFDEDDNHDQVDDSSDDSASSTPRSSANGKQLSDSGGSNTSGTSQFSDSGSRKIFTSRGELFNSFENNKTRAGKRADSSTTNLRQSSANVPNSNPTSSSPTVSPSPSSPGTNESADPNVKKEPVNKIKQRINGSCDQYIHQFITLLLTSDKALSAQTANLLPPMLYQLVLLTISSVRIQNSRLHPNSPHLNTSSGHHHHHHGSHSTFNPLFNSISDSLDLRKFIKIKLVPLPSDRANNPSNNGNQVVSVTGEYVSGVVISKNIAHKKMQTRIQNPKVLLLKGSLEFQRGERLTSFDSLIQQEAEYLKLVVDRIAALKPDVVVIEKTVSRVALDMILEKSITLVLNVRMVVLERIARFTGAVIISAVENSGLNEGVLGRNVKEFKVCTWKTGTTATTNHHPPASGKGDKGGDKGAAAASQQGKKTLMYFGGCQKEMGCSIVLKGGTIEVLRDIKRMLLFSIYAAYNIHLQKSVLYDFSAVPICATDNNSKDGSGDGAVAVLQHNSPETQQVTSFAVKIPTPTPTSFSLCIPLPQNQPALRNQFCFPNSKSSSTPLNYRTLFSFDPIPSSSSNSSSASSSSSSNSLSALKDSLSANVHSAAVLNHSGSHTNNTTSENNTQITSPPSGNASTSSHGHNHIWSINKIMSQQKLVYMYSICWTGYNKAGNLIYEQCLPWQTQIIDYYTNNDLTLGQFLEDYCFDSVSKCPKCNRIMSEHERCFVSGNGRLNVSVYEKDFELPIENPKMDKNEDKNSIQIFSYCKKCGNGTAFQTLSEATWCFSFGKLLEFYQNVNDSVLGCNSGICSHSVMKDHLRCFFYKNLVAKFEYTNIAVLDIQVPKFVLQLNASITQKVKSLTLGKVSATAAEVYDNLKSELEKLEAILTVDDEHNLNAEKEAMGGGNKIVVTEGEELRSQIRQLIVAQRNERERFFIQLANISDLPNGSVLDFNKLKRTLFASVKTWQHTLSEITEKITALPTAPPVLYKGPPNLDQNLSSSVTGMVGSPLSKSNDQAPLPVSNLNVNTPTSPSSAPSSFNPVHNNIVLPSTPQSEQINAKDPVEVQAPEPIDDNSGTSIATILSMGLDFNSPDPNSSTSSSISTSNSVSMTSSTSSIGSSLPSNPPSPRHNNTTLTISTPSTPTNSSSSTLSSPALIPASSILSNAAASTNMSSSVKSTIASDHVSTFTILPNPKPATPIFHVIPNPGIHNKLKQLQRKDIAGSLSQDLLLPPGVDDTVIIVHRDIPGSQIAYALTSVEYHRQLEGVSKLVLKTNNSKNANQDKEMNSKDKESSSAANLKESNRDVNSSGSGNSGGLGNISMNGSNSGVNMNSSGNGIGSNNNSRNNSASMIKQEDLESDLLSSDKIHLTMKYSFSANSQIAGGGLITDVNISTDDVSNPPSPRGGGLTKEAATNLAATVAATLNRDKGAQGDANDNNTKNNNADDLNSSTNAHMGSNKERFTVSVYYAKQFNALRSIVTKGDANFIQSIAQCKPWAANGGRSRCTFSKTLDERFVLKEVANIEIESFLGFAHLYFQHLYRAYYRDIPSSLVKILGLYSIIWTSNGKQIKRDIVIMENLFYGRNLKRVYDLKGSVRNRFVNTEENSDKEKGGNSGSGNKDNEDSEREAREDDAMGFSRDIMSWDKKKEEKKLTVFMDENLIDNMYKDPIYTGERTKITLSMAVWNDSLLLSNLHVMDYSLLIGVDEKENQLVVGIIDYMRTYTWDKHLETWVKFVGIVGGNPGKVPTVISPNQYKTRFRDAMWSYFVMVPTVATKIKREKEQDKNKK